MRGSDWVELAGEWLPRRWRPVVGLVVVALLYFSGTLEAALVWLITDKEAAIREDVIEPVFAPLIEDLGRRDPGIP